jgi:hypothetical protein
VKTLTLPNATVDVLAVDGISEEVYRSAHGLNKSLLTEFIRSPRHYLDAKTNQKKATDSMKMGTALHQLILRPYEEPVFAVMKKVDKRKTADKEYAANFEAENSGKIIIDEEAEKTIRAMREALMGNTRFEKIISRTSHRELGIFADRECAEGTVRLKGMLDGFCEVDGTVFDIKSTQDASYDAFRRDFRSYQYALQQVQYTYLCSRLGLGFSNFVFVAVESKPPYGVAFYTLSMDEYMRSFDKWRQSLDFFSSCQSKEDFNIGYTSETKELSF